MPTLELWGGPEGTVNRVGDAFGDQLLVTGHHHRLADLDLLAGLGIAAVRYPLLWERIAPDRPDERDWRWSDVRMAGLRQRGIRVIAGLVHHGSGPAYTNLLDEGFATGLAGHAEAVARRYPWIEAWTPVNEPVTTARFACLYGHWYPHHRDEASFWAALLNQVDGVRLAMRAVRAVNPAAQLIQTDDLGRTYATARARDQAAFDNVRRWMSWDLLFGRVVTGHPLWDRLCRYGLGERLRRIADDPCPPDVVGINHYLTSDRFLDHRLRRFPPGLRGDGTSSFADTEAVRILQPPPPNLGGVLREAWGRYGTPLAITEAHNGCTREEQMRWMADAWRTAQASREDGIDVRAVTSWALFGNEGWNTLLTGCGVYEPGAFDVRGGEPRPTALVPLLRALSTGRQPSHPVLATSGWWRRDIRLHHPAVPRPAPMRDHLRGSVAQLGATPAPLLITGATGTLGQAFAAACRHRNIVHLSTHRHMLDLDDPASIADVLDRERPWAVINAAGWVRVDDAEHEEDACRRANAVGAVRLAAACAARGIATATFSSDLVFAGRADGAYVETDTPSPLNAYGRSKAEAEAGIATLTGNHLMVRTAAFFSPFDPHNFAVHAAEALARGDRFAAAADQIVSPTYVPDLCDAVLDLVIDGERGTWHLTNGEALSWADFARRIAVGLGLDPARVDARPGATLRLRAPRPGSVPLGSVRGGLLPTLDDALGRFAVTMRKTLSQARRRTA